MVNDNGAVVLSDFSKDVGFSVRCVKNSSDGDDDLTIFNGDWSGLNNTPTTIAGYGITDAFDGEWSSLNNTPITLEGYGITDATLANVLAQSNDADNKKIINLGEPTAAQDAATKAYVDTKVNTLENTVTDLSNAVSGLTTTVDGLTTNVGNLTTNLENLANDVEALETDLNDLSDNLDANVNALLARIDTLEFFFTDSRDSNVYRTVQIGNQIWMAENLKYLPEVHDGGGSIENPRYYVYDYYGTSVADAKATPNYNTYGVLYNWAAAMAGATSSTVNPSGVQGICPAGWHLPSNAEWIQLTDYLGENAGGKLKEAGFDYWLSPNADATNESGFTALPGGVNFMGVLYDFIGEIGTWWTATDDGSLDAIYRHLGFDNGGIHNEMVQKRFGLSVRCIKNASDDWSSLNNTPTTLEGYGITDATLANVLAQGNSAGSQNIANLANPTNAQDAATKAYVDALETTVTTLGTTVTTLETTVNTLLSRIETLEIINNGLTDSRDGNRYNIVKIGEQFWMAENLKYLPSVNGSGESLEVPYYYVYNYTSDNLEVAKATENYATYGVLYNWPAAKIACPAGWHLPSDDEWTILTDYLDENAGGKLKEAGTTHWTGPNTGANNESGFTALPGGYRNYSGSFYGIGNYGVWWSSTDGGTNDAWSRDLNYYNSNISRYGDSRGSGFSVRCLRD